jgi:cytochrome c2
MAGLGIGFLLVLHLLSIPASEASAGEVRSLRFARRSKPVASLTLAELRAGSSAVEIQVFEPYEEAEARFDALPFASVLDTVYGKSWRDEEELLFTCSDGYQPTVPVQRVVDHRALLAFDRPGAQGFTVRKRESGEERTISLAPFYLVWDNLQSQSLRRDADYGWPYQVVAVDLIRTRDHFPRMTPADDAPPQVLAGFRAFRVHCSRCHKINGEGGTIGPDLNQVVSPVEYRERDWLRAWIEDPARINPGARMPRLNPALPDREQVIDDILLYLEAISKKKLPSDAEARGES